MKIGAQLYTVRDACQTPEGFADTLARVADMGFSTVHLWILRDNFRVRVVFESLGFRPDGARRTRIENDQELVLTRYIYNL